MRAKLSILILLMAFGATKFIGCAQQTPADQKIVAVIESDHPISFAALNKYVHDEFYHRKFSDKTEAYQHALDAMIIHQLKCTDFFKRGLHTDQQLMQNIRRNINEELLVKYFESEYLRKYTKSEFARQIYAQMGKQVFYRQIVLPKPENATGTQIDSLKNLAITIKTKADQGADFHELSTQYSNALTAPRNDTTVISIDWRGSMANPRNRAIFTLNEGSVRVLETNDAFYIVKIADVKAVELEPFEKMKDELIPKLKEYYYFTSLQEFDRDKKELLDSAHIEWNENALNQLVEWSRIPDFYTGIYKDTLQNAIASNRNVTILTYPNGQVDLTEYLRLLNETLILSNSPDITQKDLKQFIIEAIRSDKIIQKAQEAGYEKELLRPYTANPVIRYNIKKLYDQVMIESKIPEPTNAALREFYQANKDSLYYQLEKINLFAMIYSEKAAAEKVWEQIQAGIPFEEAGNRWFVKTFIKDRDGQIKSYLSKEPPYLGEAAFALQESEVDGIIEYMDPEKGQQYAVIKCARRTPEKQLSYADVQKSIADDFISYNRGKISRQVEKDLRNEYRVRIYDNVLRKALESAAKEKPLSVEKKVQ